MTAFYYSENFKQQNDMSLNSIYQRMEQLYVTTGQRFILIWSRPLLLKHNRFKVQFDVFDKERS